MFVKEIMNKNLIKVTPETSLLEAAALMKSHNIGFLPVTKGQMAVGVITDRDIVLALAKEQKTDIKVGFRGRNRGK